MIYTIQKFLKEVIIIMKVFFFWLGVLIRQDVCCPYSEISKYEYATNRIYTTTISVKIRLVFFIYTTLLTALYATSFFRSNIIQFTHIISIYLQY